MKIRIRYNKVINVGQLYALSAIVLSSILLQILHGDSRRYNQSTMQAFYFFEKIQNIKKGEIIQCFCNDVLVGSQIWTGPYTTVPSMGDDDMDYSINYCDEGSNPKFIVLKSNAESILLHGNTPSWRSNGLFVIDYMSETPFPHQYRLKKVYPNPFNPATNIEFSLPEFSDVILNIYNSKGQLVESIINENYPPGDYKIKWNASAQSSGVYFLRFSAGNYQKNQKLMLMK